MRTPLLGRLALLGLLPALVAVGGVAQIDMASAQPTLTTLAATPTSPLTGRGEAEDLAGPGQRAVRLQRLSELAATTYRTTRQRARRLEEHAASLAERAAEAAELSEEAGRRTESADGLVAAVKELYTETSLDAAAEAAANQAHATELADGARQAATDAAAAALEARAAWRRAEQRAAEMQLADTARSAARAAITLATFARDYRPGSDEQDRRNRRALAAWHDYLRELAAAQVVPPVAAVLADPTTLPEPYRPVTGRGGAGVPGLALVDRFANTPLVVLPAGTIEAVSRAFSRVGTREPSLSTSVAAAECGGLVRTAWDESGLAIAPDSGTQLQSLAPVPTARAAVGDVFFVGDAASGLRSSTIALDDGLMIGVDPATGRVDVQRLERRDVLAAGRVAAPAATDPVPASPGCGVPLTTDVPTGAGLWSPPLGAYEAVMSAGYGDSGSLWSSGSHTGQDFSAPLGTPVHAMRGGVVSVENPSWAGNLVRIDHGSGVETWYAHLSTVAVSDGDEVESGTPIGTVGSEGNSTGPHLHLELRLDGAPTDPLAILDPLAAAATLSDHDNGVLPDGVLCPATPAGGLLRCDAAVSLRLLASAYESELGEELCLTDTYRSRSGQEGLALMKPDLAAVPGTSMHGWGVAIDVCGGAESFGTPEHEYLLAQGPSYGWIHPEWAGADGSKPEAWHFEFEGATQG